MRHKDNGILIGPQLLRETILAKFWYMVWQVWLPLRGSRPSISQWTHSPGIPFLAADTFNPPGWLGMTSRSAYSKTPHFQQRSTTSVRSTKFIPNPLYFPSSTYFLFALAHFQTQPKESSKSPALRSHKAFLFTASASEGLVQEQAANVR